MEDLKTFLQVAASVYLSERIEARCIRVLRARFAQFSWFLCRIMNHEVFAVVVVVEAFALDGSRAMEL